jgi:hypothetical protein
MLPVFCCRDFPLGRGAYSGGEGTHARDGDIDCADFECSKNKQCESDSITGSI